VPRSTREAQGIDSQLHRESTQAGGALLLVTFLAHQEK
jgi:hypothetical protein